MKKTILLCFLFICTGFLLGKEIWRRESNQRYYFLVEGIYDDNTIFETNIEQLKKKVMEYKEHKIYVYVGITKEIEVAEKIKNYYQNNKIQIEEKYLSNEELSTNIEQFDILVKKAESKEEIMKIQEVVLANYEEIIKNRE